MVIERTFKSLSPIADHQLGCLLGHPFRRELPKEGLPGRLIFARRNLPVHDFPVAIRPHPKSAEHDAFLLALHGSTTSLSVHGHLPAWIGDFDPHAIDQEHRWGRREGLRLEGLSPLPHRRHDAMARGHGQHLAKGYVHRLLQISQTQPKTVVHHLLVEKGPPAALVTADRLPLQIAVAFAQLGDPQVRNAAILRDQCAAVAAAAGLLCLASPGQVFLALGAHIRSQFGFQRLFDHLLGGGHDGVIDLLAERTFDMTRKPLAIDNLHRVIKVPAVVPLLGMAHRDILLYKPGGVTLWFYRMFQFFSIPRNDPYTIGFRSMWGTEHSSGAGRSPCRASTRRASPRCTRA